MSAWKSPWPSGSVNRRPDPVEAAAELKEIMKKYSNGIVAWPSGKVSKNTTHKSTPRPKAKKPWAHKLRKQCE